MIASCEFGCEDSARIPSVFPPGTNSRKEVSTRVRGRNGVAHGLDNENAREGRVDEVSYESKHPGIRAAEKEVDQDQDEHGEHLDHRRGHHLADMAA